MSALTRTLKGFLGSTTKVSGASAAIANALMQKENVRRVASMALRPGVKPTAGPNVVLQSRQRSSAASAMEHDDDGVDHISIDGKILHVAWQDGHVSKYHTTWLRDNCTCPNCCHPESKQKLVCVADLPEVCQPAHEPMVDDSAVTIEWAENGHTHVSQYNLHWLRSHCRSLRVGLHDERRAGKQMLWNGSLKADIPDVQFADFTSSDKALHRSLESLHRLGFFFVRNMPDKLGNVRKVAERMGPLRNTFYGMTWEVEYTPNPSNIASSSLALPLHQDLRYFENPPGVQLLHCLRAAPGGVTQLVDGFHVATQLRAKEPEAFDILSRVPVTYHYRTATQHRRFKHKIITLHDDGSLDKLHYSPPWEGSLDAPVELMTDFYRAYRLFTKMCRDPAAELAVRMDPGDCVVFDNHRVLHARTQFDERYPRLLQGCYVDTCDFTSQLAVLREKHGANFSA
eukprot:comp23057_c0_seq1/m.36927 comp23057_c0_seq1/g.36927  ORF comp23057_c0_seq1/g.36927 comp23057_c0_seq1/m.36927 type:complete len:456 (-) comp23057_c0_seq1:498-1865(-)